MKTAALAAALILLSPAVPVPADAKPSMNFVEGSEKRVTIDLRDSDIIDTLKFLSQKGNFNIYINPDIQGRVTLYLQDVRIIDILDIILLSNKLAHHEADSIVSIVTQAEYLARFGEEYNDAREVKWLRLQYAAPGQIFKMLEPTKSKVGSIVVDESSGTLILIDTLEKVKFMSDIVKELDQPLETRTFDLSYSKAIDAKTLLLSQIDTKGGVIINADERSNQVFVTALPTRMKEIEKMVERVDRKTREVIIDSQIVKIVLSDDYKKGVDWRYMFQKGLLEPLDFSVNLPADVDASFGSLQYSTFGADGFEILMEFLKTLGESKILASPRLTVVEGSEAKILIGTREAYVTTTTTTGSSDLATVSESVSFIDVGISLNVSPLVNKEGYVTMKIKPEVSSVVRTLETPSGNQIPIVDTTTAETRVMVKDGTTIVIGGLRKDEKLSSSNRIPGFADLPLVGGLFSYNSTEIEQTELVVFITPHVIEGDKNMSRDGHDSVGVAAVGKGFQAYPSGKVPPSSGGDEPMMRGGPVHAAIDTADIEMKGLLTYPLKKDQRV